MNKRFLILSALAFCFTLPAQAGSVREEIELHGQYWQRVSTSSAIYLRGPKAQQMLNRDIARCVVELRELERLGAVKNAIPAYAEDVVLSTDEAQLAGWDAPERDENLFAEHTDYQDFEGCMLAKGWERIKYVPFDIADKSRENYLKAHIDYQKKYSENKPGYDGDYDNLNK